MTRLNWSRIKYTPGLCGTSCTFFCRSGFSFFNAATRPQITREERNGKLAASDRLAYTHCSHGPVGCLENTKRQQARPATGRWLQHESGKKAPARFSRALAVSTWKTTLSLRPRRSGGSRFLVLNHSGWLGGQYYFAHDNSIAHC